MRANQSNEIFILTAVSAGRSGESEAGHAAINFGTWLLVRSARCSGHGLKWGTNRDVRTTDGAEGYF